MKKYLVAIIDASTAVLFVERFYCKESELEDKMSDFIESVEGNWSDCSWGVITDIKVNI